jgi:hypothetical protein
MDFNARLSPSEFFLIGAGLAPKKECQMRLKRIQISSTGKKKTSARTYPKSRQL